MRVEEPRGSAGLSPREVLICWVLPSSLGVPEFQALGQIHQRRTGLKFTERPQKRGSSKAGFDTKLLGLGGGCTQWDRGAGCNSQISPP